MKFKYILYYLVPLLIFAIGFNLPLQLAISLWMTCLILFTDSIKHKDTKRIVLSSIWTAMFGTVFFIVIASYMEFILQTAVSLFVVISIGQVTYVRYIMKGG